MMIHREPDPVEHLKQLAEDTLRTVEAVADAAGEHLRASERAMSADVFVTSADNRMGQTVDHTALARRNLSDIQQQVTADLRHLEREPVLVRVVAREGTEDPVVYYVSRVTPVAPKGSPHKFTSYRGPLGRIAARQVGDEVAVDVQGTERTFEILEKACVIPVKATEWDAIDNTFDLGDGTHRAAPSLRGLLYWQPDEVEEGDVLAELIGEGTVPRNLFDVAKRRVVDRMELRDRPALDRFQDEIFRKPLDEQLMISGPPGSGKTTTLIKRLGQKLDLQALDEEELELVERYERQSKRPFRESWVMFTPTELLKQYLKEAFNKEGIAAPESRIRTWSQHRRELARDVLPILRSVDRGVFSLDDSRSFLTTSAIRDTPSWFDDFSRFHSEWVATALLAAAQLLARTTNDRAKVVGEKVLRVVSATAGGDAGSPPTVSAAAVVALHNQRGDAEDLIRDERARADGMINDWLRAILKKNRAALDEFANTLDGDPVAVSQDDGDEEDYGDEEALHEAQTDQESSEDRRRRAFKMATSGLRSIARAKWTGRPIGPTSQAGKVLAWMGDGIPSDAELCRLGECLAMVRELRVLSRPVRLYLDQVPRAYGQFRRRNLSADTWYSPDAGEAVRRQALNGLEVDQILLLMLTRARELEERLAGTRAAEIESGPHFEAIRSVRLARKAQVLVDEATDFSPIQLRCMLALAHPTTRAFCASGDVLQRVTPWGIRGIEKMRWVTESLEVNEVAIGYRQTRQLTEFADRLARLAGNPRGTVALPQNVDATGFKPVLGENLDASELVEWIARRVLEIQRKVGRFPSIAVLVHQESEVEPLASALGARLRDDNAAVVACPQGRVVGADGDVRVFDVQHIKGLEFEAALFVGVDSLADVAPDLFDKLLYVGATRAATFLGLACVGRLPSKLAPLRHMLTDRWIVAGQGGNLGASERSEAREMVAHGLATFIFDISAEQVPRVLAEDFAQQLKQKYPGISAKVVDVREGSYILVLWIEGPEGQIAAIQADVVNGTAPQLRIGAGVRAVRVEWRLSMDSSEQYAIESVPAATASSSVLVVLMVSANPDNSVRLRVDKEFRQIIDKVRRSKYRDCFRFEPVLAATFEELRTALMEHEPHVLHISSHGTEDGALIFEADGEGSRAVPKKNLLRLFNARKDRLRLVFLNACHSRVIAAEIPPTIDTAIGMDRAVFDDLAIAFAAAFYEALGFANPVDNAFDTALTSLNDSHDEVPVLFPPVDKDPDNRRKQPLVTRA